MNGTPKIVRYINQFDLRASLEADAKVAFKREIGVTFNLTLGRTETVEVFRVPVAKPLGMPEVYLTVSCSALSASTLSAYSAGPASISTAFNASGYLTTCKLCILFMVVLMP